MKLLLSWSGTSSKKVATALRQWLPDVIQSVRPWMSAIDIGAGMRWNREIEKELSETKFGIICLTKSNVEAPWILFEAGALAKTLDETFVCPYLININPADLPQGPLTQFQAKRSNKTDTWDLVCTINKALGKDALPENQLTRTFERWWPDLEEILGNLQEDNTDSEPARSLENMVEEVLELVRGLSRGQSYQDNLLQHLGWRTEVGATVPEGSNGRSLFYGQGARFGEASASKRWVKRHNFVYKTIEPEHTNDNKEGTLIEENE